MNPRVPRRKTGHRLRPRTGSFEADSDAPVLVSDFKRELIEKPKGRGGKKAGDFFKKKQKIRPYSV
jgi:hypothetical protein